MSEPKQDGPRWAILTVLCVSLLLVTLDSTILNVALPAILRSLHTSASGLQWIVDAYSVVFAGLLLVVGSLGDRWGRKWVFMTGLALFAAGSACSAFSSTPDQLIAARAFMGVGAAAIMPSTLSILTNVFTDPDARSRAIGIWSGTTGIGLAAGPLAGGWLLARFWWGSVFLVNVPIAVAGLLATALVIPNSKNPETKSADPLGAALSMSGMGVLLWGIIDAPNRSWGSPIVIAALGAGLVILTGFAFWERHTPSPMLQLSFFRSRRFSVAISSMGLVVFALMGGLFLLTQYLQFSLGYSALAAGLRVTPIAGTILVVAPLSSLIVRVVGTKPVVVTGLVLISAGLGLMSSITVHGTYIDALPAFLLMGAGTGLAFAPCTESVMGSLPANQAGVGSATNGTALQMGGALGVAVLGSLLNSRYRHRMTPAIAHYAVPHSVHDLILGSLGGALGVAKAVGGAPGADLAFLSREAFVSGMEVGATAGAIVVGIAAVVALLLLPNRAPANNQKVEIPEIST